MLSQIKYSKQIVQSTPLLFAILFAAGLNNSQAQGTWTRKADFGGTARQAAVGFSIGSKGYLGTGDDGGYNRDLWEYDPATNAWTQKANFEGTARWYASAFSIGSKGYIGVGYAGGYRNDFWEYDPAANTWIQKANFGGTARSGSVGFSIGSKGYIGTGYDGISYKNDFWEYDPVTDVWIQKANFGGTARTTPVGFSVGSKGYIGTGFDGGDKNDFWEYDPVTDAWIQKSDFGGTARTTAVGFSIGSKGYIGTGTDNSYKNDFWEYDTATDAWTQKASFGGAARIYAVGFSIDSKGYIGTGKASNGFTKDFWEYTPDISSCVVPTNLSVTNITSTSAKLIWDAVAGAQGYRIRYKVSNASVWTQKAAFGNSKLISGLLPGTQYRWEVKTYCQINPPVKSDWSGRQTFTTAALRISDASLQQMQQTSFQIYPNPARGGTTIQFTFRQSSHVYIKVYDLSGKEMATLFDGTLAAGSHSLPLNTNHFSKGVYLVKLISDLGIENQKLIVQ